MNERGSYSFVELMKILDDLIVFEVRAELRGRHHLDGHGHHVSVNRNVLVGRQLLPSRHQLLSDLKQNLILQLQFEELDVI